MDSLQKFNTLVGEVHERLTTTYLEAFDPSIQEHGGYTLSLDNLRMLAEFELANYWLQRAEHPLHYAPSEFGSTDLATRHCRWMSDKDSIWRWFFTELSFYESKGDPAITMRVNNAIYGAANLEDLRAYLRFMTDEHLDLYLQLADGLGPVAFNEPAADFLKYLLVSRVRHQFL